MESLIIEFADMLVEKIKSRGYITDQDIEELYQVEIGNDAYARIIDSFAEESVREGGERGPLIGGQYFQGKVARDSMPITLLQKTVEAKQEFMNSVMDLLRKDLVVISQEASDSEIQKTKNRLIHRYKLDAKRWETEHSLRFNWRTVVYSNNPESLEIGLIIERQELKSRLHAVELTLEEKRTTPRGKHEGNS